MAKNFGTLEDGSLPDDIIFVQGPPGVVGDKGLPGISGNKGPVGEIGETGDQGPVGIVGDIGPQGPQGQQGPQGIQGIQGPQGLMGDKGPQGETGLRGPTGPQGIKGLDGLTGPTGDKGLTGIGGDTGDQGSKGPTGATGSIGLTGARGITGPQGPIGDKGGTNTPIYGISQDSTYADVSYYVADYTTSRGTVRGWKAKFDCRTYFQSGSTAVNSSATFTPNRRASYADPTNPKLDNIDAPIVLNILIAASDLVSNSSNSKTTSFRNVIGPGFISITPDTRSTTSQTYPFPPISDLGLDSNGNIAFLRNSDAMRSYSQTFTSSGTGTSDTYYFSEHKFTFWVDGSMITWPDDSEAVGLALNTVYTRKERISFSGLTFVKIGIDAANDINLGAYRPVIYPYGTRQL